MAEKLKRGAESVRPSSGRGMWFLQPPVERFGASFFVDMGNSCVFFPLSSLDLIHHSSLYSLFSLNPHLTPLQTSQLFQRCPTTRPH